METTGASEAREQQKCTADQPHLSGPVFMFVHDWPGFHRDDGIRGWRAVAQWVRSIGLDPTSYGTHSMRRSKVAYIYKKTGHLRAVQLLLGHTKMDSTVRYLGVESEDALPTSESVEIYRCGPSSQTARRRYSALAVNACNEPEELDAAHGLKVALRD